MKLLIADDSELLRQNFRKLLDGSATITAIIEASTVIDTLQQVKAARPDVLVLDIHLPDGSGFDVLHAIFDTPQEFQPTVIVFTNFPSELNRRKSYALGARFFFDKSNEYEQLIELLESL
jgi:DNA-binding NarL/FixJ family response regulator